MGFETSYRLRLLAACLLPCLLLLPAAPPSTWADGDTPRVTVSWDNGFRIEDKRDPDLYFLRLRFGFQLRYTYLWFEDTVVENQGGNWSNFMMRRARLYADGLAPNGNWRYLFHVQLEPQGNVNLHDALVQWQRFRWARVQFGRMKIPYGLEFWQSGFSLNGVERTIFSGIDDVDGKAKDAFGRTVDRYWPGGNARLPVSGQQIPGTLYPSGGFHLYRSQGIDLNGDVAVPGLSPDSTLQYWLGLYNGRDTRGFANPNERMLYSLRVAYAPLGPWNLTVQGDWIGNVEPKLVLLSSWYLYDDLAWQRYDGSQGRLVDCPEYRIRDWGYNLALVFRYQGFSADLEYGFEQFQQKGGTPETGGTYNRLGGRIDLGYFVIPRRWELVFRWAYVQRIRENSESASLYTGLGLVQTEQGPAVEGDLQEYTGGINVYLHGHHQKICLDGSLLFRALHPTDPARPVHDQRDYRIRVMFQQIF